MAKKYIVQVIEFIGLADTKLGTKSAKEISGYKPGTKEIWKKAFFANNKDVKDKILDYNKGDYVGIRLVNDPDLNKYWNIDDIVEVSDDDIEKAVEREEKYGTKPGGSGSGGPPSSVRPAGGGISRGDDTNRSAAIYLARDIIGMTCDGAIPLSPEMVAIHAIEIADKYIYPYIKDGKVAVEAISKDEKEESPAEEEKPRSRRSSREALAPPKVD